MLLFFGEGSIPVHTRCDRAEVHADSASFSHVDCAPFIHGLQLIMYLQGTVWILAQRAFLGIEAEAFAGQFKAAADRPGEYAVADHPFAPFGLVSLAAAHDADGGLSRCGQPTFIPDEADATRAAYVESHAGDLLVLCVAGGARVLADLDRRPGDAPAGGSDGPQP